MTSQAFTFKSDKLLSSIITQASIRQSANLCRLNKIICPHAEDIRALWDTGAECSCISRGLARHLGLKPVDMSPLRGVTDVTESPVYLIDILLPSKAMIGDLRVLEFLDNGFFELIIGMDVITFGDFAVSNKDGKTIMSFRTPPADTPIDFLEAIKSNSSR